MPSIVDIDPPVPKKKIFKGFTIYGHGGHLSHVTWIFIYTLVPPSYRCFIVNLALIGLAVSEKNIFEIVNGRRTDGWTPQHGCTKSLPYETNDSRERNCEKA